MKLLRKTIVYIVLLITVVSKRDALAQTNAVPTEYFGVLYEIKKDLELMQEKFNQSKKDQKALDEALRYFFVTHIPKNKNNIENLEVLIPKLSGQRKLSLIALRDNLKQADELGKMINPADLDENSPGFNRARMEQTYYRLKAFSPPTGSVPGSNERAPTSVNSENGRAILQDAVSAKISDPRFHKAEYRASETATSELTTLNLVVKKIKTDLEALNQSFYKKQISQTEWQSRFRTEIVPMIDSFETQLLKRQKEVSHQSYYTHIIGEQVSLLRKIKQTSDTKFINGALERLQIKYRMLDTK